MGIPGFAKFIQDNHNVCFENYKLANCTLVIDGHSLSCQLYNWNQIPQPDARCHSCYGGDYDKYAHTIVDFFSLLQKANVKPIVVFDGGFEAKKLPTILKRMQDKINIGIVNDCVLERNQPWKFVFPLFLRETFKDVLKQLAIPMAMCQFEGDTEIASLAHMLDCPVLTFDSDYFLFGVKYIPFKSLKNKTVKESDQSTSYNFIPCQLYQIEKLLETYPGLEQGTLHLLPVLIGNDYIQADVFSKFMRNVLGSSAENQIKLLLNWVAKQTLETAINKILETFDTAQERNSILNAIEKIVTSYQLTHSKLLHHFNIEISSTKEFRELDFVSLKNKVQKPHGRNLDEDGPGCSKTPRLVEESLDYLDEKAVHIPEYSSEKLNIAHLEENDNKTSRISELFQKNFAKCIYPSSFMDILTQHTYYCIPQVENGGVENSHILSFNILRAIHKILSGGTSESSNGDSCKYFTIVGRSIGTKVKSFIQTNYSVSVPSLEEIEKLPLQNKRAVLFRILNIEHDNVRTLLEQFPTEWHMFLIALKFVASNTYIEASLIYSLVITFIILNYVDQKIGYYRSPQVYRSTYNSETKNWRQRTSDISFRADRNCFHSLLEQDCAVFMEKVIHFFTINPYEESHNFDRQLVHKVAQIQSCMLHIKYLNGLLKMPYPDLLIHKIINGTLIYNFTKYVNAKYPGSEKHYFKQLLADCPSILAGLEYAMGHINKQVF